MGCHEDTELNEVEKNECLTSAMEVVKNSDESNAAEYRQVYMLLKRGAANLVRQTLEDCEGDRATCLAPIQEKLLSMQPASSSRRASRRRTAALVQQTPSPSSRSSWAPVATMTKGSTGS